MWSWLEKLMNVFRGEEREIEADEMHPPSQVKSRQLQAKTKSIYPREREGSREQDDFRVDKQRQFRFPVVPDHYPERRRIEKELGIEPLNEAKEKRPSKSERIPNRRSAQVDEQRVEIPPAKKPQTDLRRASRAENPGMAGIEKRTYQPSDIVSPVYGKITPDTMEMEHRIHTTAGIVYPLQEQEEQLSQLKQWQQLQMAGKAEQKPLEEAEEPLVEAAANEAAAASEATVASEAETENEEDTVIEPLFLFTRKPQPVVEEPEIEEELASPTFQESTYAETEVEVEEETESEAEAEAEAEAESEAEAVIEESPILDEAAVEGEVSGDNFSSETFEVEEEDSFKNIHSFEVEEEVIQKQEEAETAIEEETAVEEGFSPEVVRLLERAEASPLRTFNEETVQAPAPTVYVPPAAPPAPSMSVPNMIEQKPSDEIQAGPAYQLPSLDLLNPSPEPTGDDDEHTQLQKLLLEETLANFNVSAQVVGIVKGPSVTRFELQPAPGVKVNKITSLIDDIKLNLAAKDIRIEAPISGRNAIGIEVPNLSSQPVLIEKIISSEAFQQHSSPLAVALGMDIGGAPIIADIKKMPHGLIAGATGSGKSVCINSIIVSLLYKATPEQVRLLLIDPKMVELAPYNHLPHLVTPVVTEAKQATAALKWAVEEMEKRYTLFVDAGVRDIERYNQTTDDILPYIVIVIDELADLMMVSPQDVEDCIIRIAQKARACGIHLLLATQRPSVDVITGNIKANVPTRLAFAVFSQVDSRTILDQSGAERLLGRGDMLFLESGTTPLRLQGNFVTDDEIERITHIIKKQRKPSYLFSKEDLEQQVQSFDAGDDPLYLEALVFVAEQGQASASGLQRRFRVGYNRAARLIEMMEADGYVAGQSGGKARAVLITLEDAQAVAEGSTLL